MNERQTIGWRERIDLPDWGVQGIEAKSDTGARSSAVDVKNLKIEEDDYVSFDVALSRTDRNLSKPVRMKIKRHTQVKSSNGHITERVVVETTLRIGPVEKNVDVTLVCRKRMQCRMLIGRTALGEDFLVSSNDVYLLTRKSEPPKKPRKKSSRKKSARRLRDRSEEE
ncbi:RimK/LysX family protein [uncultured Rubinisphaera sp.]|uniref:ATP-dependent zinc protease family protein n=1 Tax=uncultured Rubinisphaera sp. TaxID=1678686 RepID=UPI0030D9F392